MALDRVPLTPEQAEEIDNLRRLGQFTEDVWHPLFIQEGLHGFRLRAAAVLYRTRPLTISAVADQVHLSRGELIDWFHTQGIAPGSIRQKKRMCPLTGMRGSNKSDLIPNQLAETSFGARPRPDLGISVGVAYSFCVKLLMCKRPFSG